MGAEGRWQRPVRWIRDHLSLHSSVGNVGLGWVR
jgi:hypothetical protein